MTDRQTPDRQPDEKRDKKRDKKRKSLTPRLRRQAIQGGLRQPSRDIDLEDKQK